MTKLIDDVFEKAGGRQKLRASLNLSKQSLSDWKRAGYVPAKHAAAVEALTNIPRNVLCPGFDWGVMTAPQPETNKRRRVPAKVGA